MGIDTMPAAQAVEALIHDYGRLVFQVIYGLTGDWQESQDLTQDTFLQALRAIEAAQQASGAHFHAKAWLLQIAANTVRMQRRRRSLVRFVPFSALGRKNTMPSLWVSAPHRYSLPGTAWEAQPRTRLRSSLNGTWFSAPWRNCPIPCA